MAGAIVIALLLIVAGLKPAGKGLVLGTVFSILNFIIMAQTAPYRLGKTQKKAFALSLGSILFRYVFLAIPLIVAIRFDQFELIAVIFGIFMVQLTIFSDHLLRLFPSQREKQF